MKIKKELTYYTNKNRFPKEVLEFSLLICIFPNFRPSYSAMIGIYKASVIYQREHSTI